MMWHEEPFQVLSLYGVRIVPPAAPTMFVSTVRAWETLPDSLRVQVEGREAVHVTGQQDRGGDEGDLTAPIREKEESVTLPIAYPNPRTGRTMLYVSQMMTREIVGLPPDQSEALLEELFAHLYAPENTYLHEWQEGDLVAWDNQSVQHARSMVEQEGTERTLRKVISPIPVISGKVEAPKFSAAS
jgi:taurine dioxygenase